MGGLVKGLFGGKEAKSTSTSTVQVPAWLDQRNQSLASRAETLSNQGFTPYTQQRIAAFTPDALNAFDLTRGNTGKYSNLLDTASGSVLDLISRAQGPTSNDITSRMNPFLDNVLNISKRNTIDDYNTAQADRDREAGMIGAFGGSRVAVRQSAAEKQLMQDLEDLDYQGRFDAFNSARDQFNRDTDVLSSGIDQALGTASGGQAYDQADVTALLRQGELQRLRNQDQLDFDYSEFDREQAYPYEQLNFLANIINPLTGAYAGGTTTSTQKPEEGSGLGKIAGLASTAASLASLFSDKRVKENIKDVGQLDNGLTVYSYNYKGDNTPRIGLMAQEVEKKNPNAVGEVDGIKTVNYGEAVKEFAEGGKATKKNKRVDNMDQETVAFSDGQGGVNEFVINEIIRNWLDKGYNLGSDRTISGSYPIDAQGNEMMGLPWVHGQERFIPAQYGPGFAEGGKVQPNRASEARLKGVAPIGSPRLPSAPSIAPARETSAIDPEGLEGLVDAFKQGYGDIRSLFSDDYDFGFNTGMDAGLTLDQALRMGSGATKGMYGPGFAEGGIVTGLRDRLKLPEIPLDPETQSKAGMLGRQVVNKLGNAPYYALAPLQAVEDAAIPFINDAFFTPAAQVDRERLDAKNRAKGEASKDTDVRDLISNKFGRGNGRLSVDDSGEGFAGGTNSIPGDGMDDPNNIYSPPSNQQQRVAAPTMGGFPDFMYSNVSNEALARRRAQRQTSGGINTPLLAFGLTMMGAKGDIFEQAAEGAAVATQAIASQNERERKEALLEHEMRRQQFQDYLNLLKTQAYIAQVQKQGEKNNAITPYQQAKLDMDQKRLDIQQQRLNHDIQADLDLFPADDDGLDMNSSAFDDLIREFGLFNNDQE